MYDESKISIPERISSGILLTVVLISFTVDTMCDRVRSFFK